MNTVTINADALYSPQAEQYFTRSDRRIMTGLRATLTVLGLPFPDYALRRTPGPNPAAAALAAFHSDNPQLRHRAAVLPRRANATPDRVAAARASSNRNPDQ
ncbi:hypothetical protein NYR55_11400 [Sphingomonas sp. BGYR3]|uniref:hypothetical protein n=1 Tax=Sphingomonas sp. BGYR3 TaxID=2975483 RepID=UPI0021A5DF9E|nr:hypothetical protein [Sphingomonas sp. BGYR3]MDG5489219.1 hypothetical protein [Sphingomonas sp. BGYR3]